MNIASAGRFSITSLLVVSVWLAVHLTLWCLPHVFETLNARLVDQLFRLRAAVPFLQPPYDDTIVHVDLNDSSIRELGTFDLSRSDYTQVVRNLSRMGVAAQIYDFIFAAPADAQQDRDLIAATRAAGHVYFGLAFALQQGPPQLQHVQSLASMQYLSQTSWELRSSGAADTLYRGRNPLLTFPDLAMAARGLGYLSVKADRDGAFRRIPLLVRYGEAFYPSLVLRAVCDYLGVTPANISLEAGQHLILHGARRPGTERSRDIVIPIDRFGNMVINFIGPWGSLRHYRFADIVFAADDPTDLALWRDELAGRLALISDVSTGSSEIGAVPTDARFPLSGLHAQAINTILTERFLRQLDPTAMLGVEAALLVLALALSATCGALSLALSMLALTLSYLTVAVAGFVYAHLIFGMARPLLVLFLVTAAVLAYRYVRAEALRRTFEPYFPLAVVNKLVANRQAFGLGERKVLTILFSDIKSFSTHTATMAPERVRELLNEYFEVMTDIVFKYSGTLDKFMGDGLMVFFGDPEPQPNHALRGVCAAMEMQLKVAALRARWAATNGSLPLHVRIGINTGEVVVGNMGSARRLSYTVVGAEVNLAKRLEDHAPVDGILMARPTYEQVKAYIPACTSAWIQVKGFEAPIEVYSLIVDDAVYPPL